MNKIENLSTCTNLSVVNKINEIIDELNIPESVEIVSGSVDRCLISGTSNFYSKLTIITENKSLLIFEITNYSNTKEIKNIFIESIDSTDQTYLKTNSNKEFIYLDQSGDIRISYPNKCNILFDGISGDYNEIAPSDSRVTTPVASTKPSQWGLYVPHGVELGKDSDLDANKQTITVNDSWVTITNQYDNNAKAYNYAIAFDRTKIKTFVYDLCDALNTAVEGILQVIGNRDDSTGDTIWANINRLDGELDTVSSDITNINSSIQNINSSISNINTELTQVGGQVSQNTTNITELTQRVDEIYLDDGEGNVTGLLQDAIDKNDEQDDRLDSLESRVDGHDDDIEGIRTDIRNLQLSNSYMVSMSHENDYTRISRFKKDSQNDFTVEYDVSTDRKDHIQFIVDDSGIQLVNLTNNSYDNFERTSGVTTLNLNIVDSVAGCYIHSMTIGSGTYVFLTQNALYYCNGYFYICDSYSDQGGYIDAGNGPFNYTKSEYPNYVNKNVSDSKDRRVGYKIAINKSTLESIVSAYNSAHSLTLFVDEISSEADLPAPYEQTEPYDKLVPTITEISTTSSGGELVIYESVTDGDNSFIDVYLKRYDSTNDTTVSVDILNNISTNLKTVTSNYKDYTDFNFSTTAKKLNCDADFLHNIDPVIVTDDNVNDVIDGMDNVASSGQTPKYGRKIKIPTKSQTFPLKVHDVSKGSSASGYETEYDPSSAAQTVNALSEVKVTDGSGLTGNGTNSDPLNIDSTNLEFNPNQFDVVPDQTTNKTEINIKSSILNGNTELIQFNISSSAAQPTVYSAISNAYAANKLPILYCNISNGTLYWVPIYNGALGYSFSCISNEGAVKKVSINPTTKVIESGDYGANIVTKETNQGSTVESRVEKLAIDMDFLTVIGNNTDLGLLVPLTNTPQTQKKLICGVGSDTAQWVDDVPEITYEATVTGSSGNYTVTITSGTSPGAMVEQIVSGAKLSLHVMSTSVPEVNGKIFYVEGYQEYQDDPRLYPWVRFRYDVQAGGGYIVYGWHAPTSTLINWSFSHNEFLQIVAMDSFPSTVDVGKLYVI